MVGALSCRSCGTAFGPNDTFCAKCGVRVTPPPPTWPGGGGGATQAGVQLGDDEDVMLDKVREMTVGEYEVRGVLGRGGMASVFVAYDLTLNRKVALKVMHPGLLGDAGMRERFRLEARMAARLDHPNIVTVHAVKERGSIVFFDLKLIDGTSLDRLLRHRTTPMPSKVARWAISKIAEALHYAHGEGIVHRDMKPGNVMVERRGDCIVTDFGIAKATESPHLTMTGAVVGTPAYMSPEQCLGEDVTASSDQYSLGIMAYEMLTGQTPFSGSMLMIQLGHVEKTPTPPHEIVPAIPESVSGVVMKMLAKKPADRWPTLALAADALIEGLGATDSQMRREMSLLIHELPKDTGHSLPATPRTPSLAMSTPIQGTQAIKAAARVDEASTQQVPVGEARTLELTPKSAPTVSAAPPADVSSTSTPTVPTAETVRRRRTPLIFAAAAAVVATITVVSLKGKQSEAPLVEATPVLADSAQLAAAAAAAAAEAARIADSLADFADTTIARVSVNPPRIEVKVGDSVRVRAFAHSATGDALQRTMQWTTSDSTKAVVSPDGWVKGVARTSVVDAVFITATLAKKSGVTVVTVK
jgi:serine/threonine protein kinase